MLLRTSNAMDNFTIDLTIRAKVHHSAVLDDSYLGALQAAVIQTG